MSTTSSGHTPVTDFPLYRCHKEVRALKIKEVRQEDVTGGHVKWIMVPEDESYPPFEVPFSFVHKQTPIPGGYYVRDANGAFFAALAESFESEYTRV